MKTRSRFLPAMPAIAAVAALLTPAIAAAQTQVFAYPAAGQSAEQQSRDKYECHNWAVSQTGFDPTQAAPLPPANQPPPAYGYSDQRPPPPPQQSSGGFLGIGNGGALQGTGMVGDAATGAALGAAGGAIAGNAGQGAAIGAIASTLFGAYKRSSTDTSPQQQQQAYQQQQYQQQQYQQQQYQQQSNQVYADRLNKQSDYNTAFGACMKSRQYSIN
ncbi:MAG: hypothetical protein HY749_15585 [Gammaproteobacteria bacterium]|nr:hypothetical protein [Gammaproteobacteria bacterium]MBI5617313.1 hypothetical protein [Gammaproteobacteria bacterium]